MRSRQFLSFSVIGTLGFLVDTAILYAVLLFGDFFYLGRALSFLGAATFTWYLNRRITFQNEASDILRQWWRFIVTNSGGGLVNYLTYSLLILAFQFVRDYPVLGVAAGSIAGLIINFNLSRRFVFGAHTDAQTNARNGRQ